MIILDTCVISETLKPVPSQTALKWLDTVPEESVYLTSLVIGELKRGIEELETGSKKSCLNLWLEQLLDRFAGKILPVDESVCLTWGILCARLKPRGIVLPVMDSLIAATAISHNALLATRNGKDFEHTGVELIDPWAIE